MFPVLLQSIISNQMRLRRLRGVLRHCVVKKFCIIKTDAEHELRTFDVTKYVRAEE